MENVEGTPMVVSIDEFGYLKVEFNYLMKGLGHKNLPLYSNNRNGQKTSSQENFGYSSE